VGLIAKWKRRLQLGRQALSEIWDYIKKLDTETTPQEVLDEITLIIDRYDQQGKE
jgi:hypothetical protein